MGLRAEIINRLAEDIVGPYSPNEMLTPRLSSRGTPLQCRPGDLYLSGILWPQKTRMDPAEDQRIGMEGEDDDSDVGSPSEAEQTPFASMMRPSAAGISFATESDGGSPRLSIKVSFGMYSPERYCLETVDKESVAWRRKQQTIVLQDQLLTKNHDKIPLEGEGVTKGVYLYVRKIPRPSGELVSVSLVNGIELDAEAGREDIERHTLFQVEVEVRPGHGTRLVARPSRRPCIEKEDWSANLLYRSKLEYATGHTCSARWEVEGSAPATLVATTWLPKTKVMDTDPAGHEVFRKLSQDGEATSPLSASWLSKASDKELHKALTLLPSAYGEWIAIQENKASNLASEHQEAARDSIAECRKVQNRMMAGANAIGDNQAIAEAFRLANQAMLTQFRWKKGISNIEMAWRPFQLGFMLLSTKSTLLKDSLDDSGVNERDIMDLLWFPTGGGKTEAYLGLIAMLIFYRRLKHGKDPNRGSGVAAIMRYTLRLLTTQQFMRASSLILACELIRRSNEDRLGTMPISIGLWVGGGASPNRIAEAAKALDGERGLSSPEQLTQCPACGGRLEWKMNRAASEVNVNCRGDGCPLSALTPLPIWTVDDDIYKKLPTLLIGTVDKFAQIVRRFETNALFGINRKSPPDLIVQDELHLISGPLGSLTGMYEALIDKLFSCGGTRPKIIGSTATIRKANDQVLGLFNRITEQFPPPCLDAEDSGFAVRQEQSSGRIYCGVTTAGRSAKFALQATSASLLQSVQALSHTVGVLELDEWWTLVAYFNSLRELGGALVLMQDDVHDAVEIIAFRRNEEPRNSREVRELTSRLDQIEIRDILDDLEVKSIEDGALDVVLASNMLSVGVDISRLGLMVVNGQPKGRSEYIQATSRVGRGNVPGLIVPILNNAKSRDRSHYENFNTWHESLYRDVEPASVTPFAPRSRDKALHAVLVGLARHLVPGLLEVPDINRADPQIIDDLVQYLCERANEIDPEETSVPAEAYGIIDRWRSKSARHYWDQRLPSDSLLQGAEDAAAKRAAGYCVGEAWPTPNSMRTVEPSVHFRIES